MRHEAGSLLISSPKETQSDLNDLVNVWIAQEYRHQRASRTRFNNPMTQARRNQALHFPGVQAATELPREDKPEVRHYQTWKPLDLVKSRQ